MKKNVKNILEKIKIESSAPCRIDMGGTLDISTFYYPLNYLKPSTFNIAIDLKTSVGLYPYDEGFIKVSSKGFESASYPIKEMPFNHPLGLMFAIASYFNADGIHIVVDSSSPIKSALGGSSSASVALIGAYFKALRYLGEKFPSKQKIAMLAHALESSVSGVQCGMQDQLAASFGGVNAWYWQISLNNAVFTKKSILEKKSFIDLEKRILIAYCGIPHESKDINGTWIKQFVSGNYRNIWAEIINLTNRFIELILKREFQEASMLMNKETNLRREMTPDVLDKTGEKLFESAVKNNCGARFTGAGGGGCIWALGEPNDIDALRIIWKDIISTEKEALLLESKISSSGLA